MVLWTIMPIELVLETEVTLPVYEEIDFNGVTVSVEKISDSQCRIVRLISSDPEDFLRPELQPGVVLTYRPVFENI